MRFKLKIIKEATAYKKKGVKIPSLKDELIKYVAQGGEKPKWFISFTELEKLGINPQSKYDTPLGIYAYPLNDNIYYQLINKSLPFAQEKPYINIFTVKDEANIFYLREDDSSQLYQKTLDYAVDRNLFIFNNYDSSSSYQARYAVREYLKELDPEWNSDEKVFEASLDIVLENHIRDILKFERLVSEVDDVDEISYVASYKLKRLMETLAYHKVIPPDKIVDQEDYEEAATRIAIDISSIVLNNIKLIPSNKSQIEREVELNAYNHPRFGTKAGAMWFITHVASKENPVKWNAIFRKDLGIDGFVDTGLGIIHENEPTQAVFFSKNILTNIKRFKNDFLKLGSANDSPLYKALSD